MAIKRVKIKKNLRPSSYYDYYTGLVPLVECRSCLCIGDDIKFQISSPCPNCGHFLLREDSTVSVSRYEGLWVNNWKLLRPSTWFNGGWVKVTMKSKGKPDASLVPDDLFEGMVSEEGHVRDCT